MILQNNWQLLSFSITKKSSSLWKNLPKKHSICLWSIWLIIKYLTNSRLAIRQFLVTKSPLKCTFLNKQCAILSKQVEQCLNNRCVLTCTHTCSFILLLLKPAQIFIFSFFKPLLICYLFTHNCSLNTNTKQWKGGNRGKRQGEKESNINFGTKRHLIII